MQATSKLLVVGSGGSVGQDECVPTVRCEAVPPDRILSHWRRRELRELAVRGVDGPGMHILDVLPNSFARTEGRVFVWRIGKDFTWFLWIRVRLS